MTFEIKDLNKTIKKSVAIKKMRDYNQKKRKL